MVSARVRQQVREAAESAWDGPPARVFVGVPITDDLLERLSDEYDGLWFEAGNEGEIVITGLAGGSAAWIGFWIASQIQAWIDSGGRGLGRDSSGGYHPPQGRPRGPDLSWLSDATLMLLSEAQMRGRFWPVAPDFVIEIVSPSQNLAEQRQKMREWIAAEVRLGVLIAPDGEFVELYWGDGRAETFFGYDEVSCDPVMPGFVLRCDEIWRR